MKKIIVKDFMFSAAESCSWEKSETTFAAYLLCQINKR